MATALAPGVARKLKKVLETRTTDNPDVLASLAALSTFYGDNTPQARRNLKSSIEERSLAINHHFLNASLPAQLALDKVEQEVSALTVCCDQIEKVLSSCGSSTGDIISTTERLQQELEIITQRQDIVSCFLRDYQLSNEEINALRGEELNENFFKALAHVQEIHANCKILLRTHHQRAGLELMDLMSVYQEGAYERLCRWVQAECKKLGDSDNPEVSDILKKAVCCLRERPVLFKYCAEEVANMRHNALFRRFITALTRGGPGGLPRPIEVHAHDPLRYVGDMLGWLHQALASERELILTLLDPDSMADSGPAERRLSGNTQINDSVKDLEATFVLDRIFEGACRPFKVRVDQVLQSQPSLLISYKLSNTLEFYNFTISELLGKDTALCKTIGSLKEAAQTTFFNIVKSRGEKLQRYPPLVPADLAPPPAVREGISIVIELIQTYNSIMLPPSAPKPSFLPVISSLLDPVVQMCEKAAEAHRAKGAFSRRRSGSDFGSNTRDSLSSVDAILAKNLSFTAQSAETSSKIYLINCLSAMKEPLTTHPAASDYIQNLQSMIQTHLNQLVQKESEQILQKCNLSSKLALIKSQLDASSSNPLSNTTEMNSVSLSESLRVFFGFVTGSEGSLPEFEQLQNPKLRNEASSGLGRSLSEVYEVVFNAVLDAKNGYAEPRSLVKHSPGDIRTMLAI
ncbi:hypothetical protein LUZ60_014748 [Juncus effusus]|nr:hypothetical protein LUZ60_014748 [Juncus effusus]